MQRAEGQYCRQETIAFAEALRGHIAAFDMGFLYRALNNLGIDADLRFVDTRDVALSIPELKSHSLTAVAEHYGIAT